eukprot:TRINITY_DN16002_c0_g1_i1.p2 TRINITY_DN16002_c0_g1~~TRINITY_DN16002_c0_g1_i1.p2  ORF type:complete len:107 (+),score=22.30 TRINITY_DN16002_c0_g1_i1:422-742(+)
MALHLLNSNLSMLILAAEVSGMTAATMPPPSTRAPRLALVGHYLRQLRQLSAAVGGAVAPIERDATVGCAGASAGGVCGPVNRIDVEFAACLAEKSEKLFVELQNL